MIRVQLVDGESVLPPQLQLLQDASYSNDRFLFKRPFPPANAV